MTCSFAMRRSRKLLFDAGLNRNTRPRASQTTHAGGSDPPSETEGATPPRPLRPTPPPGNTLNKRLDGAGEAGARTRVVCGLVDFFGPARAASPGRRGLGAGVAVGPVVRKGQRWLHLELTLEPRTTLLPALLVLELVLVQRGGLLDPVRVTELNRQ